MIDTAQILALTSAQFFGLALVLTQFGLRFRSPLQGAAISVPASALLFLAGSLFLVDFGQWNWRGFMIFAGVGCMFPVAVTILTFQSNRFVGPNMTGAIGNLAPVFAVALAAIIFGAPLGPVDAIGVLVIVFGVTLIATARGSSQGNWSRWALTLPLAAAFLRGIVQPGVKSGLAYWPDPFAAVTIGYVVSGVLVIAASACWRRPDMATADRRGLFWFILVGVCNGMAVFTMYAALARGDVSAVAPLVASYPLATLVFSALLLGRMTINPRLIAGVGVTVLGVAALLVV
ncbi:MAG: DMT family transporter [Alphaproteobacteria bacterium]|nr:DMT family transporter [Alphaproteobacteria bacterium]